VPTGAAPNSCWASRLTSVKGSLRINMVPTSCGIDSVGQCAIPRFYHVVVPMTR
jgi:hypothetical protein